MVVSSFGQGMRVAFLGMGLMGQPMVARLLTHGYHLKVWNRTRAKAKQFEDDGIVAESAQAAVDGADIVIFMLTDGSAVDEVLRGLDLSGTASDCIVIDMSSIDPETARAHASLTRAAGRGYLDAPVSGGTSGAANGSLSIMAGGAVADFDRCREFLAVFGTPRLMGEAGCGQVAKLANQAIVGVTIGAVSEAFLLAESSGVDLVALREALMGGFASSKILEQHGQRMIDGDFKPGGKSSVQRKDLDSVMTLARGHSLELPLSQLVTGLYTAMSSQHSQLDHSALYLHLAARSGIEKTALNGKGES